MKFEFDLEQAENELESIEDLLSVFFGFFVEERPFGEVDTTSALWFVHQCKTYESVVNAARDKVRKVRADMEAAIENHYHGENTKGGEAA